MNTTLTTLATEQLLCSIRLLTGCDYLQICGNGKNGFERKQCGELSDTLQFIQQRPDDSFTEEVEYQINDISVALALKHPKHIFICIQEHQGTSTEQRRQAVMHMSQHKQMEIELLCESEFPAWLVALCEEQNQQQQGKEKAQLLHLCCSVFATMSVFDQFQLLTMDGLTKLRTRNALQRAIDDNIKVSSMNLCMIHCRDFQIVNRKFGQAKGDLVINEIAKIIDEHTRSGDLACRFGGALFGIASNANGVEEGLKLAQKLQSELHNRPYLKNAIRLSFNLGVAHIKKEDCLDEEASASSILISRAEQALKAAQISDKPSVVHWEADKFNYEEQDFNYIGGIFTPDNVTNYRNMLLLWDISSIIADEYEFNRLLLNVVERLAYTFEFSIAGIIGLEQDSPFEQAIAVSEMADVSRVDINSNELVEPLRQLGAKAIENGRHVEHQSEHERFLLVPLGAELNACFFLVGKEQTLDLAHDSVMLFAGFARQIGKALKRSQLEEELNRNLEKQNAQLEEELNAIKNGLKSSALVYRSQAMQNIVSQTQRAAQTDTTILVTGESGTGKEKLMHAIHNLSPRNKAPMIIVDCGSIPETLIESELFGYVKGAFTGAQSSNTGKIQAANGGILVLDEIGELPMSMQPKLLRFVQEKQFTPVGSNKSISVDVKIVALTNRDLAAEVQKGTFRQDLYFRLNVVTLHNPPLRERMEDLDLLCQHFLTKFASQFETSRKFLSPQTLDKMRQYSWPGNIRELENKLMQASLMCQGDEILFEDINILVNAPAAQFEEPLERRPSQSSQNNAVYAMAGIENSYAESNYVNNPISAKEHLATRPPSSNGRNDDWLTAYEQAVDKLLSQVLSSHEYYQVELGTWIELSLFKFTQQECSTNKLVAARLQIPISTARRKVNKAIEFEISDYPPAWELLVSLLQKLADGSVQIPQPVETLKQTLLKSILRHSPNNMTHAAQLLGVSEPTLYKLKRLL